jgi:hypothetical protein
MTHPVIDPEEIVTGLYRQILKRDPDLGGLSAYVGLIQRVGINAAIEVIVKDFLASKEYAAKTAKEPNLAATLNAPGRELINGKKVSHILSLGTHCLTSAILKKHRLKSYSLPFDWLFTSPETVIDCLANDFRIFLDQSFYRPLNRSSGEPGAEHLWYLENHAVQHFFTHRDPMRNDDYQYFVRAVERFRHVMQSDSGKLFVMISRPRFDLRETFPELSRMVTRKTKNAALICIQLTESSSVPGCHGMRRLVRDDNHALYEFTPSSEELGIGFPEVVDDLAVLRLIHQYDIELSPSI